jgi:predicted  nucleic acid-binding Zn-ribbon protein
MGWTLAILFIISAVLLVISFTKAFQASKAEQKRIDMVHIAVMKEFNDMKDSIRNIELDLEVVMKEAGIQLSLNEIIFMREVLDLYRRNYSIESIAALKEVSESEIYQMLEPFLTVKDEGGKVANES